jgi:hypothetical protein
VDEGKSEELNQKLFYKLKESQMKLLSLSYSLLSNGQRPHIYLQLVEEASFRKREMFDKILQLAIFTRVRVVSPPIQQGSRAWEVELVHLRIDWLQLLVSIKRVTK